jgi:predicted outer membrane repeat protein
MKKGGGIHGLYIPFQCTNCSFLHNKAVEYGGAISLETNDSKIDGCAFLRSVVSDCGINGGSAVYANNTVSNSIFSVTNSMFIESVVKGSCTSLLYIRLLLFFCLVYKDIAVRNLGVTLTNTGCYSNTGENRVYFFYCNYFIYFLCISVCSKIFVIGSSTSIPNIDNTLIRNSFTASPAGKDHWSCYSSINPCRTVTFAMVFKYSISYILFM